MATLRPSSPRRPPTERRIVDGMHDATLAVRARLPTELRPAQLTVNRFWLLHRILEEGRTTTGPLATMEGLTPGTVRGSVDQLVREGLVLRKTTASDRRLGELVASPEGKGRGHGVWERLGETFQPIGRTIPRSDLEAVVRGVDALRPSPRGGETSAGPGRRP
jgi:hypothetical protein